MSTRPSDRRSFDPAVVFAGATVIVACLGLAAVYAATAYLGRGSFYEMLLFYPGDTFGPLSDGPSTTFGAHRFGDLLLPLLQTASGNPYLTDVTFRSNYAPFAHLMLLPFTHLPYKAAFWLYLVASVTIMSVPLWRALVGRRADTRLLVVSVVIGLSFPVWVTLDRGNIQAVVVGFALLGALAVARGQWRLAALLLAVPPALKVYPVFLLLLFVRERRWKDLLLSIGVGAALTTAGLLSMEGSPLRNARAFWFQTAVFRDAVFDPLVVNRYNISPISLFQWIQLRSDIFGERLGGALVYHFNTVAMVAAIGCLGLALSRRLSRFEAATLMLLPTLFLLELLSAYSLLLLLVPLVFLFSAGRGVGKAEMCAAILIALLMAPKTVAVDHTGTTFAIIAYPILEAVVFLVVLTAFLDRRFRLLERLTARVRAEAA